MDNLLALLTAPDGLTGLVTTVAGARNAVKQSDLQALRDTVAALEFDESTQAATTCRADVAAQVVANRSFPLPRRGQM